MRSYTIRAFALGCALIAMAGPLCRAQAQIAGDWQGTVNVQGDVYHIVLHLSAAQDGALSAKVDNIDRGEMGVAADAVALKDGKLTMKIDAYQGVYEGTVNKDATEISGGWTGEHSAELNFTRVPAPAAAKPAEAAALPVPASIAGDWQGILSAQGNNYHIVLHVTAAGDGTLSAKVDNIDQGAMGVAANSVALKDTKVTVVVDAFEGVYEGTLNKDGTEIDGTWSQGQTFELNFTRVPAKPAA